MRPRHLRNLARAYVTEGHSFNQTAAAFAIPVGTLKSWAHREKWTHATTPATTPTPDKTNDSATTSATTSHVEKYRGITRYDLPGKTIVEKSINFRNLKKGTYPPQRWKIPSTVEGQALLDAITAAITRNRKHP